MDWIHEERIFPALVTCLNQFCRTATRKFRPFWGTKFCLNNIKIRIKVMIKVKVKIKIKIKIKTKIKIVSKIKII